MSARRRAGHSGWRPAGGIPQCDRLERQPGLHAQQGLPCGRWGQGLQGQFGKHRSVKGQPGLAGSQNKDPRDLCEPLDPVSCRPRGPAFWTGCRLRGPPGPGQQIPLVSRAQSQDAEKVGFRKAKHTPAGVALPWPAWQATPRPQESWSVSSAEKPPRSRVFGSAWSLGWADTGCLWRVSGVAAVGQWAGLALGTVAVAEPTLDLCRGAPSASQGPTLPGSPLLRANGWVSVTGHLREHNIPSIQRGHNTHGWACPLVHCTHGRVSTCTCVHVTEPRECLCVCVCVYGVGVHTDGGCTQQPPWMSCEYTTPATMEGMWAQTQKGM